MSPGRQFRPDTVGADVQRPDAARLGARSRLTPWWARVLAVWVASRIITTSMVLVLASVQGANPWTGARPRYVDFANIWDGRWYNIVAVAGYPSTLPLTDAGQVAENAWAFMPAYPATVRLVMLLTGLEWNSVAVFVSLVFSLGTALVFYKLMCRVLPTGTAMFSVVLFCVAPLSPVLQFGYAESMSLFFLVLALDLLLQRRYVLMFPVVAVMALTRPTGLAFALALVLHVAHRWFTRRTDPYSAQERMLTVGLAAFSALMGLAWPAIAWAVTGDPTAYTDTELAWRAPYIGYHELVPFSAWFQGGVWWLGAPLGILAVIAVVLAFGMSMFSPAVKRLGPDLRFWVVSYAVYLLAVFFPQSSTFRLLMPMFPLLGAIAQLRSRWIRVGIVLLSIAAQWGWLLICWGVDGADWTPP